MLITRRHMSISAQGKGKGKGSGQILQNDQQNSKSTLEADGVLSLNSNALQVLDNTTLRGGAINIKAGGGIIKRGHIDWETQDTATMRSAELKPLAGMMSIESGGDNPLTAEPGNRIVSAGDLAVKHNGKFQISARAGNNGNPSAQTVSVSAKGNIGIVAGEVDIDAANIAAGKDLALVADRGNVDIRAVRNTFDAYSSKKQEEEIHKDIAEINNKIQSIKNSPEYIAEYNRIEQERLKSVEELQERIRTEKVANLGEFLELDPNFADIKNDFAYIDTLTQNLNRPIALLEKEKTTLEKSLAVLNSPGRGHEHKTATLSGQKHQTACRRRH